MSFWEILSPSFLLFPALVGSAMIAVVCPLVGAHLMLRHRIFLGLTLPQVAACGVAFTFWLYHAAGATHGAGGERLIAAGGSLVFTLAGMGVLAYLDQRAAGSTEGRLAAAYALASALTILFVVFNPAGELEIVNLLKGEVIALSTQDLKLLGAVYGVVLFGLILYRREFLLASFDRDLSFLLTGGNVQWSFWLYVLCGITIAVGVIMAGPLLVFGFMVLPPLAARPLARGMGWFFSLSAMIGLSTAILGFYFSVRLDLPLGPSDVALGCLLVFVTHGARRVLRRNWRLAGACLAAVVLTASCGGTRTGQKLDVQAVGGRDVWVAAVRNGTSQDLRLPSANPLRSLAEMGGRVEVGDRLTVMELLRDALGQELTAQGVAVSFPENNDRRLGSWPFGADAASRNARAANLSGYLLLSEIRRWDGDPQGLLRTWVAFKLVRIDAGTAIWEQQVKKTISSAGARADQSALEAIRAILRDVLGS